VRALFSALQSVIAIGAFEQFSKSVWKKEQFEERRRIKASIINLPEHSYLNGSGQNTWGHIRFTGCSRPIKINQPPNVSCGTFVYFMVRNVVVKDVAK